MVLTNHTQQPTAVQSEEQPIACHIACNYPSLAMETVHRVSPHCPVSPCLTQTSSEGVFSSQVAVQ